MLFSSCDWDVDPPPVAVFSINPLQGVQALQCFSYPDAAKVIGRTLYPVIYTRDWHFECTIFDCNALDRAKLSRRVSGS